MTVVHRRIDSPLSNVGTSIFTVMSQLASDEGALNLAQGFPDFDAPPELIDLVHFHSQKGRNQYAPSDGLPDFRVEIGKTFGEAYGKKIDPVEEVTVTSGATEAIMAAVTALVAPGDEVIIFDPSYDSYDPLVRLNGGVPVRINLSSPNYAIDWPAFESSLGEKTKLVMINSPHNPTGAVLSPDDLKQLDKLARRYDFFVISDEVYHHIIFDGTEHQSVLRYPELAARSVAVFSFGKIVHATGWKIGFAVAPAYITNEIRRVHQFLTFSVHTPTQYALTDYLKGGLDFGALSQFFQAKRDVFLSHLKNPAFRPIMSRGTYFQLLSYDFDTPDVVIARRITKEFKLASIPISVFYDDGTDQHVLRFCFAKEDNTLIQGAEILNGVHYE